jgi:hypothetical protein
MSENHDAADELRELLAALREDAITDLQAQRLTALLRDDREARRMYVRYMAIEAHLHGGGTDSRFSEDEQVAACDNSPGVATCPPIIVQNPAGFSFPVAVFGGFAFSYAAAAVIVAIGLLIGWACRVSPPQFDHSEVAMKTTRTKDFSVPDVKKVVVGQITGLIECRWANPHEAPVGYDRITLGRKYDLVSGLMEISYNTGAKVILQGPCTYEVESTTGGYLAAGRLTAKVEKKREGGRRKADQKYQSPNLQISKSPNLESPSPLFSVRTPTAVVTDLGTEFGVEVDGSGVSSAHVFQGKIEVRTIGGATDGRTVPLGENESARVEFGQDRIAAVVRQPSRPSSFVREMPKRVRIKLFNTGVNLKNGEPDPHWQAAARSDDPDFKPRPAVVLENGMWLSNQFDRSQWISFALGGMPSTPVYTFRTSFQLTGVRPATAILHGRFIVDNHVRAIRFNGREIPVPKHGYEEFGFFHPFIIDCGYVEGANVLEIDVQNIVPGRADSPSSPMGLLVELDGSVLSAWPEPAAIERQKSNVMGQVVNLPGQITNLPHYPDVNFLRCNKPNNVRKKELE